MGTDPLDSLQGVLRHAADSTMTPLALPDLARLARRKARRRARHRIAGMVVSSVVGVLLAALLLSSRFGPHQQIVSDPSPVTPSDSQAHQADRIRVELASLEIEAANLQRAASQLQQSQALDERARRAAQALAQPGALEQIEATRQRTALMLLHDAEDTKSRSQADENYRRAARLFPETPAGRLAAGRLKG